MPLLLAALWALLSAGAAWGRRGGGSLTSGERGACIPPNERLRIQERVRADQAKRQEREARRTGVLAPYPFFPQAGTLLEDILLGQFVDLDPGAGRVLDWQCTDWTYDAHTGLDSDIRSFAEQEIGVPVFAVLDGVVTDAHDGEADRNTSWSGAPANYAVLYHGGTHYTLYYHLKRGSVRATPGQQVRAGTQIGLTGSSGNSTWPHLHFESWNGSPATPFEPDVGPCSTGGSNGWDRPLSIPRGTFLTDLALTDAPLQSLPGLPFEAPRRGLFVTGSRDVGVWINVANLPAASRWRIRYLRPGGGAQFDTGDQGFGNRDAWRRCWFWWQYRVALDLPGTWHLQIDINGAALARAPFTVVSPETPAANRPPGPISVALDPPLPTTRDVVFCRVAPPYLLGDPDYDVVRYHYRWSAGGRALRDVTTAARADALPWGLARGGELLRCEVTPGDGTADGPGAEARATIQELPNRAPLVPDLLGPEGQAVVSATPTLRALVRDPDGDPCRLVVELAQGTFVFQTATLQSESGTEIAFTVPEEQALAPGAWSWRARGVDARGLAGEWSSSRVLQVSRPPGVPELLLPLDGAVTSPTPVLRLRAAVPGGGAGRLALQVIQGATTRNYDGVAVTGGAEAAFAVPAGEPLGPGRWRWRARMVAADGAEYAWSYSPSFEVPFPPPGVTLRPSLDPLGLPALSAGDAAGAMGLAEAGLSTWDAGTQQYVPLNALSALLPGRGYWVDSAAPVALRFAGAPAAGMFAVDLQPGWNLVSAPFPEPLVWDTRVLRVRRDAEVKALADAAVAGWVDGCVWQWRGGTRQTGEYVLVTDAGALPGAASEIPPWRAFWICAHAACTLLLPPPVQTRRQIQAAVQSARGWTACVRATGTSGTATIAVGVGDGSEVHLALPPDPPAGGARLRMAVAGPDGPDGVQVRSGATGRHEWELTVTPAADAESVTLSWPELRALPRGTSLTLVDPATGIRRSLRTTPAYTFTADGPRHLLVVAEPRAALLPLITGMAIEAGRGRNARTVRFTLSTDASVDLEVLSPSGRVVAVAARGRASLAGLNQVTWAGAASPGIYLLRATARTEEGSQAQAVTPVAVVR